MRLHDIISKYDFKAWIDHRGKIHEFDNETHLDYLIEIDPDNIDDTQELFHTYLENGWIRVGIDGKEFYTQGILKYTTKRTLRALYNIISNKITDLYTIDFEDMDFMTFDDRKKALYYISKITKQVIKEDIDYMFPNSKVRDENGKLLPVYHGTPNPKFKRFLNHARGGLGGIMGFWFASKKEAASAFAKPRFAGIDPGIKKCYLNIQNPKEYNEYSSFIHDLSVISSDLESAAKTLRRSLIKQGYDGMVIRNSDTDNAGLRDDWVAFYPKQIEILV